MTCLTNNWLWPVSELWTCETELLNWTENWHGNDKASKSKILEPSLGIVPIWLLLGWVGLGRFARGHFQIFIICRMLNPSEIFCKLQKKLLCIMLNINFPTPIFIDVLKKFQHKPNLILFPSSNHIHNIRRATTNQRKGKMEVSNPVEGSENVRQEKVNYFK